MSHYTNDDVQEMIIELDIDRVKELLQEGGIEIIVQKGAEHEAREALWELMLGQSPN